MTVFKNYLKVAKSYISVIVVFTAVFMAIAILTSLNSDSGTTYQATDAKIAIVNHDEDTEFIKNFKDYIQDSAELVTLKTDDESLKDALFFRKVDYIMIIPKDYTNHFMAGKKVKIEVMAVPDSASAMYSKELVNQYLNIANVYVKAGVPVDILAEKVKEDVSKQIDVHMMGGNDNTEMQYVQAFYNFANYTLLAITILVVSMIMTSFNDEKIKRRNLISPVSYKSINRQLLLGNIFVSIGIWLLYVVVSCGLYPTTMFSSHGLLFMLNSGVFMTTTLAIGFLLATITNNKEAISGMSNVIGLGSSFISGAFVPQELLGSFVLFIAKFTPSYWYVTNNIEISKIGTFNFDSLQPILINIGILFGFTFIIFIIIQILTRFKLKK